MTINILVATPQTSFGELLRHSLEESSKYRVSLVQSGREALAASGRIKFDLAILDAAITDQPFTTFIHALAEPNPSLRLVVISPENDSSRLSLNGLSPDAYLNLPFNAPALFELVGRLVAGSSASDQASTGPVEAFHTPSFQKNSSQLSASLAYQLVQTSAQAALVICRRELLASTGRLDFKQLQEMADILNHYWDDQDSSDLSRYVHLSGGGGEYKIYATSLTEGAVLALVYDPAAALMRMRSQAVKAAQALRALPDEAEPAAEPVAQAEIEQPLPVSSFSVIEDQSIPVTFTPPTSVEAGNDGLDDLLLTTAPTGQEADDLLLAMENDTNHNSAQPLAAVTLTLHEPAPTDQELIEPDDEFEEGSGEEGEMPEVSLSDLLAAMPPPDPAEHPVVPGIEWTSGDDENEPSGDFLFPWEKADQIQAADSASLEKTQVAPLSPPLTPALAVETTQPASNLPFEAAPPAPALPPHFSDPAPSEGATEKIIHITSKPKLEQVTTPMIVQPVSLTEKIAPPANSESSQTRVVNPDMWNKTEELENLSAEFASLSYTCVMLPRLPDIQITGSLSHKLAEWLPNICLAYGWRLVDQAIRPDIFQWTIQVSATVSPGSVVRVIRLQTSHHIFEQFNRYADVIPSGDFWAPGYLIISGSQPPDPRLIGEYIHQTRKRQGGTR